MSRTTGPDVVTAAASRGLIQERAVADLPPFGVDTTMHVVGAIEVVAGLLVALRPRLGAPVVAASPAGICWRRWLCSP